MRQEICREVGPDEKWICCICPYCKTVRYSLIWITPKGREAGRAIPCSFCGNVLCNEIWKPYTGKVRPIQ